MKTLEIKNHRTLVRIFSDFAFHCVTISIGRFR